MTATNGFGTKAEIGAELRELAAKMAGTTYSEGMAMTAFAVLRDVDGYAAVPEEWGDVQHRIAAAAKAGSREHLLALALETASTFVDDPEFQHNWLTDIGAFLGEPEMCRNFAEIIRKFGGEKPWTSVTLLLVLSGDKTLLTRTKKAPDELAAMNGDLGPLRVRYEGATEEHLKAWPLMIAYIVTPS